MSLMEMPKNTDTKSMVLCGISTVGALMSAYAAFAGIGASPVVPASWFITFGIIAFGLYGAGFFLAPAILITMNFSASPDKYHLFFARMIGFLMLFVCYVVYSLDDSIAFQYIGIVNFGIAIFGPTTAGLYLEPKQTPAEHMPAHILFLVGGTIGVLATM